MNVVSEKQDKFREEKDKELAEDELKNLPSFVSTPEHVVKKFGTSLLALPPSSTSSTLHFLHFTDLSLTLSLVVSLFPSRSQLPRARGFFKCLGPGCYSFTNRPAGPSRRHREIWYL